MLLQTVLGNTIWGIRVVEIILILSMAKLISLLVPQDKASSLPLSGLGAMFLSGYYFSFFDYHATGQTEIWQAFCIVAAWVLVTRSLLQTFHVAGAGILLGTAFMFKLTAALPALGISFILLYRAGSLEFTSEQSRFSWFSIKTVLKHMGILSLGVTISLGLFTLPFFLKGAFGFLWETVITFNILYSSVFKSIKWSYFQFFLELTGIYTAIGILLICFALFIHIRSKTWSALKFAGIGLVMFGLALGAVEMQAKFFRYHFAIVLPFVVVLFLWSVQTLLKSRACLAYAMVFMCLSLGILISPSTPLSPCSTAYCKHIGSTWKYSRGDMSRWDYLKPFNFLTPYRSLEYLGQIVKQRASEKDSLCVFNSLFAIPYNIAEQRCPSRFFAGHLINYMHASPIIKQAFLPWAKEHDRSLKKNPPTFIIARPTSLYQIKRRFHEPYTPVVALGNIVLLQKDRTIQDAIHLRHPDTNAVVDLRQLHSLSTWYMVGPFKGEVYDSPLQLIKKTFEPEQKPFNIQEIFWNNGRELRWQQVKGNSPLVLLSRVFGQSKNVVAYGYTKIISSKAQIIPAWVGCDDGIQLTLNNQRVFQESDPGEFRFAQYQINLSFKKGLNYLFLKMTNNQFNWGFSIQMPRHYAKSLSYPSDIEYSNNQVP